MQPYVSCPSGVDSVIRIADRFFYFFSVKIHHIGIEFYVVLII